MPRVCVCEYACVRVSMYLCVCLYICVSVCVCKTLHAKEYVMFAVMPTEVTGGVRPMELLQTQQASQDGQVARITKGRVDQSGQNLR